MVFIGDRNNAQLSDSLGKDLDVPVVYPDVTLFSDGEREVNISAKFFKENVVLLRCISTKQSIDSFLIETALILQSLNKLGAKEITAIIPYFPYSRSDFDTLMLFASFFKQAGLSRLIVVDPHNDQLQKAFGQICTALSTEELTISAIKDLKLGDITIVSPDAGGEKRVENISKKLKFPTIILTKKRNADGDVEVGEVFQIPSRTCVIVDDMITTGSTILKSIERLKQAGAKKIYVIATHGIFTQNALDKLKNIDELIVSDSIDSGTKIKTFGLAGLIAGSLRNGSE